MLVPVDRTAEFALLLRSRQSGVEEGATLCDQGEIFYSYGAHSDEHESSETNELSKRIISMTDVIARSRRRYMDYATPRGMKDSERDELDRTLGEFLQAAMAHIDMLKGTTNSWDAHELGRILILSERLQVIATESEALRAARISDAMKGGSNNSTSNNNGRRRRANIDIDIDNIDIDGMSVSSRRSNARDNDNEDEDVGGGMDEQQFAEENAVLVADLVETRERVREAEKNVIEIANLNHIFAAKVVEQAKEIEDLYDLAVDSAHYLDYGNRELMAMKGKRNRLQYGLAATLVILSLFLLALDLALHK